MYHCRRIFCLPCLTTTFSKIMPPRGKKTANADCDDSEKSEVNSEPRGCRSRKSKATTSVTIELADKGIYQKKPRKTKKEYNNTESPAAGLNQDSTIISRNVQKKLQSTSNPSEASGQSKVPEVPNLGASQLSADRLTSGWFDRPCMELAHCLLGMKLVRVTEMGERLSGVIVETEAYPGGEDKASCSYNGRRTERIKAVYMTPGTAFVYNVYGMYTCMNISSQGDGAAVLIRGLEPSEGEDLMRKARSVRRSEKSKELLREQLCNGPSKLTQALGITKANGDQVDLATSPCMWVEKGNQIDKNDVVACKRIGINKAGEWTDKPFRFYVRGCSGVSIRDKVAEANLCD